MQTGPRSHGPHVHIHNTVVEYIGTRLERQEYTVLVEPHIRDASELLKPDIMFWHQTSDDVKVLDIAIVSDHMALEVPFKNKTEKYSVPKVCKFAKEVSQKKKVSVGGFIIINWRGAI